MSNKSLVLDWLYENALRAYPLKEDSIFLSDNYLFDSILYTVKDNDFLDAQFNSSAASVKILSIRRVADVITVTTSEGVFVFDASASFPQKVRDNGTGNLLVGGEGLLTVPNDSRTYQFSNLFFEPSVTVDFSGPWLGVANVAFADSFVELTGIVNLLEGYQVSLAFTKNTVTIGANNLYGVPIGCEHFGTLPNNCDDIISSINGVGPNLEHVLNIAAGHNITVLDDPPNHRIYVGFSFTSIDDICKTIPSRPN